MTKIVYNRCYGGFGLSDKAIERYAELKGIKLYIERRNSFSANYWTSPPEERQGIVAMEDWSSATDEQRRLTNELYENHTIEPRYISRTDPLLVQVVEELGKEADGDFAELAIAEVEAGTRYRIDEYDGIESVMTVEDYDWSVA